MKNNKAIFSIFSILFIICLGFVMGFGIVDALPITNKSVSATTVDSNIKYNTIDKEIVISDKKVLDITSKVNITYKESNVNIGLSEIVSRLSKITRTYKGKKYSTITANKLYDASVTIQGEDDLAPVEEYSFVEVVDDYFYINAGAYGDYKKAGNYTYTFHYKYDMGEDFISEFDDFTYDILPYSFLTSIDRFSAKITLPKEFYNSEQDLQDRLSYRFGKGENVEDVSYEFVNQSITENTISVELNNLNSMQGLTIQLILPNRYFNTHFTPSPLYFVVLGLVVLSILVLIAVLIYNQLQKRCIKTVEFYPPKNFNPIDVAKIYRGKVKPEDFASLMIEWASKGLVKIEEQSKKNFLITKLKDFPEIDKNSENYAGKSDEKRYFDAIFSNNSSFTTSNMAYNSSVNTAVSLLYDINPRQKRKERMLHAIVHLVATLPLLIFTIWLAEFSKLAVTSIFILLFPIIAMLIFIYTPMNIVFKCIWCGLFGGIPLCIIILNNTIYDVYGLMYITTIIFIAFNIATMFIKAHLKEDSKIRGQILGFKDFLVTCELEKLEMLIKDNENYYYDILPYCFVFNITNVMEEKFKKLQVKNPEYFEDSSGAEFHHAMALWITPIAIRHSANMHSSTGGHHGGLSGGIGGSFGGGGGGGGMRGR